MCINSTERHLLETLASSNRGSSPHQRTSPSECRKSTKEPVDIVRTTRCISVLQRTRWKPRREIWWHPPYRRLHPSFTRFESVTRRAYQHKMASYPPKFRRSAISCNWLVPPPSPKSSRLSSRRVTVSIRKAAQCESINRRRKARVSFNVSLYYQHDRLAFKARALVRHPSSRSHFYWTLALFISTGCGFSDHRHSFPSSSFPTQ